MSFVVVVVKPVQFFGPLRTMMMYLFLELLKAMVLAPTWLCHHVDPAGVDLGDMGPKV